MIHAWWVPEFLFKRDVMPNPIANNSVNLFQVEEITRTGAFVGHCAEMCGTYHSMMNFEVRVVEPNDFMAFLQQRIAGKTNAEALQAITPATAGGDHPPVRNPPRRIGPEPKRLGQLMHIEARLFEFIAAFFALCAVLYGVLTALFATGGTEWAGETGLVLTTGLALIVATFFRFVARRLDTRPEDYEGAEISDGAGELGFFSPHSWWPIMIALSGIGGGGRYRAVAAVADRRRCDIRPGVGGRAGLRVLRWSRETLIEPKRSQFGHQLIGGQFAVGPLRLTGSVGFPRHHENSPSARAQMQPRSLARW